MSGARVRGVARALLVVCALEACAREEVPAVDGSVALGDAGAEVRADAAVVVQDDAGAVGVDADDGPRDASALDAALSDASLDGSAEDTGLATDAGHLSPDAEPVVAVVPTATSVGGALTMTRYGRAPFLTPAPALDLLSQPAFSFGRELFVADWVPAPDMRPLIDGLGPHFHARSCLACHPAAGRPRSVAAGGVVDIGLLVRLARPDGAGWAPDPTLGAQLQPSSIPGVPAEGALSWVAEASADPAFTAVSATSPRVRVRVTSAGLDPATRAGPRLSPHLAGMALLERVPDAALLAGEDPNDADGDGISGRAARLAGGAIGRFGWKAVAATLRAQSAAAFAGDMGITSPDRPSDDCTAAQTACAAAPHGGLPELDGDGLDAVVTFMAYLGVPAARRADGDPGIQRGADTFEAIGCAGCHRPALTTAVDASAPLLSAQTFWPYTDLLLHDLGDALADDLGEGDASPREWRTPPLWGLGLVAASPTARYLHDGRATTLADAIAWHDGEARAARDRFVALGAAERAELLMFLESL